MNTQTTTLCTNDQVDTDAGHADYGVTDRLGRTMGTRWR